MLILPANAGDHRGVHRAPPRRRPRTLSTIANVMPAPPMPFLPEEVHGQPVILGMLAFVGDEAAARAALAPFRALATPLADMVRPIDLPGDVPARRTTRTTRPRWRERCSSTGWTAMSRPPSIEYLRASDATMRAAQLRVLGGAMARVAVDATAFAHRTDPDHGQRRGVLQRPRGSRSSAGRGSRSSRRPCDQGDDAAYVNFLGDEGPARVHDAYPGSDLAPAGGRQGALRPREPVPPEPEHPACDDLAPGAIGVDRRRLVGAATWPRPRRR